MNALKLNRRSVLRSLLGVAVMLALLPSRSLLAKALTRKPNIIYILADDLGYGDLSCYGQQKFRTPNIDRSAQEGMMFTQHYSGSTVCAPSRCALMTGLHTGHAQVRGNKEVQPEGQAPMAPGTVTISTLLKQAGYATGMFGKWGLGAPGSVSDPALFFDEFYGYNCQRQAHNYYPTHLWHNRDRVPLDERTYSHDLIMKAALDFIRAHRNGPFFCYMPVTIPHAAKHDYLYWEFTERGGKQAIRQGDFKAVRLNVSAHADAAIELYNLATDLGETTDISREHPDKVHEMERLFSEARTDSSTFPLFKR